MGPRANVPPSRAAAAELRPCATARWLAVAQRGRGELACASWEGNVMSVFYDIVAHSCAVRALSHDACC